MTLSKIAVFSILVALLVALPACSKQKKASSGQQNPPAASTPGEGQSATTSTQQTSASPNAAQQPNGPQATDKYVLDLTNYDHTLISPDDSSSLDTLVAIIKRGFLGLDARLS